MKRILFLLAVFAVPVLFHSCGSEDDTVYDETLLYGKWQSGTLFYKYLSDHTGSSWDTSVGMDEADGQPFTWQLVNSTLTQNHPGEMGSVIPKTYTVTQLTATTLKYKDNFNISNTFTKTN